MDICSLPTLFLRCSVLLPSLLIIVSILFGIFYYWFVVNRQIDLDVAVCKASQSARLRARATRLFSAGTGSQFQTLWLLRLQQQLEAS